MSADARLARWTSPLAAPCIDARQHAAFDAIRAETAKLESPAGGVTDWAEVLRLGDGFLAEVGRDLIVASALASALGHREGISGITLGASLLAKLALDASSTPARPRARANAVTSFVVRAEIALDTTKDRTRPALEALDAALGELASAMQSLGDDAPSLRPLVDRVRAALEALPPRAEASVAPAASAAVFAPPPPVVSVTPPGALDSALPDRAEQIPAFVRRVAGQLVPAAALMRATTPIDADALRITLVALYLPIHAAPETTRDARTALTAPPKLVMESLSKQQASATPETLVRDALNALERNRFALDLHVHIARALERAGTAAASMHRHEVRGLISRLPELLDRQFADGSPFASADARAFFAAWEPTTSATTANAREAESPIDALRALSRAGRATDAMALGTRLRREAASARARFEATLAMALAAEDARALALAAELHGALQADLERHALDLWEPELATTALRAGLRVATATGPESGARILFGKLAQLDPRAAFELSSSMGATPLKHGR